MGSSGEYVRAGESILLFFLVSLVHSLSCSWDHLGESRDFALLRCANEFRPSEEKHMKRSTLCLVGFVIIQLVMIRRTCPLHAESGLKHVCLR
jgi:hypothetical protein